MSNNATPERPIPHHQAWPIEKRREDMRAVITKAANEGWIGFVRPTFVASTYGVLTAEVEAELMRHLSENGEGK